jgi:hypothetical protein
VVLRRIPAPLSNFSQPASQGFFKDIVQASAIQSAFTRTHRAEVQDMLYRTQMVERVCFPNVVS